jgi:hypothetical protein
MGNASLEGLTVSTPTLRILGTVALACGIIGTILTFRGSWLAAFFCISLFGGSGAALLLMSGQITADDTGIAVVRLLSRGRADWIAITGVEYGGGNLVFRLAPRKRVVLPGPEFWSGVDKARLQQLIATKLTERGVQIKATFRAMLQAGDRS